MMERHRTDFFELLFGLAFLAAGGGFIVSQATDRSFDSAWIAAIALVTIGCAFLAATLLHQPRPKQLAFDAEGPTDQAEPADDSFPPETAPFDEPVS